MSLVSGGGQLAVQGFHLNVEHAVVGPSAGDGKALVNAVVNGFHGDRPELELRRIVPAGAPVMAALLTKVKDARPCAAQDEVMTNKQVNSWTP
jgi:hypothetical protein